MQRNHGTTHEAPTPIPPAGNDVGRIRRQSRAVQHANDAGRDGRDAAARRGRSPGQHQFLTKAEGVKLPAHLLSKYPDDITIILQYEFARLNVKDDRFEVVLWFKGRSDWVVVPFNAVKAFYDKTELKCFAD
jgi:hypothetical protein